MLASDIGIELFDDSTYEPSRLMYWPSTSSDGEYVFQEIDGAEVDPDEVLARYKDWHDVSAWPVSNRQASVVQRDIKKTGRSAFKGRTDRGIQPHIHGDTGYR